LLPSELEEQGYIVGKIGTSERILAGAIVERFARRKDGSLSPLTEGSTVVADEVRRHAGIVKVEVFEAILPQ
jgi:hypothetical protein